MKNLFFLIGLCLLTTTAFAQPESNQIYLSGGIGLNSSSGETKQGNSVTQSPSNLSFNFSPAVGYTITDKWLAGLRFSRAISNSFTDTDNGSYSSTFGWGVFGRYNMAINEKLYFFPELQLGLTNRTNEVTTAGATEATFEISSFNVGVAPGFAYFPSEHWSLEFSVGFLGFSETTATNLTLDPQAETTSSAFGFNINGLGANLSIAYYLPLRS
jgi:hypothetical protein